jgi:tetratricopeptide (TPR) repeat protein
MRRAAALAAAVVLCGAGARAAWWPFGTTPGSIRPAEALSQAGRYADVLDALTPQLMQTLRGPDLLKAYRLRGDAFERLGRPDQALGEYQVGVSLYPRSVELLTREAGLLHRDGLDETARGLFERALAIDAGDWAANLGLAEIDRRLGFLDRSAEHYESALETVPGRADVWRDYSEVLLALNEQLTAELALRKSLELEPRSADAHVLLAFVRRAQGSYDEALLQLDEAASLGAGVGALRAKALWLVELGRYDDARAAAGVVLRAEPRDAAALWVLARAALARDPALAARTLEPVLDAPGFSGQAARALSGAATELERRREDARYK